MNWSKKFRVKPGAPVKLNQIDASYTGSYDCGEQALGELALSNEQVSSLQYQMYAEHKRSLLICLQGRDASGKDGVINHVFAAMNPQGCNVHSFKVPSHQEREHDYLWRYHKAAPRQGHVAIFNRSHYEEVLVVRVHNLVAKKLWASRYQQINEFEQLLHANGTHILKFYLHIDKSEQLARFKRRLDDPNRHWKISESDYTERQHWSAYTKAFEEALGRCSTAYAPWFVIPSNHKWFRDLVVSNIVRETLQAMKMQFPAPTVEIDELRKKYHQAV